LDSAIQTVSVSLSGKTAGDKAFEGFDTLNLFLPKKALAALIESLS
jgi:hypothetical protein